MGLLPGTTTKGLTEYIFCCWVCDYSEVIHATDKAEAIEKAKMTGWFLSFGKWRCLGHNHRAGDANNESGLFVK